MNNFTSNFWSYFITVITLLGISACLVLIWLTSRKESNSNSDNTTGHVWDENLHELNNPLPLWWVILFILTIIFGIVYLVAYPGLGSNKGTFEWSSKIQYEDELLINKDKLNIVYAKYSNLDVNDIANDNNAMVIAEHLFMNHCAQCHGSDAQGSKGFPNLTDNDWLYGGTSERIIESISKGRSGIMPPMSSAVGSKQDVENLAHYVLSLSNSPHDKHKAEIGKGKFSVCAACHGSDGKGNLQIGSPNLSDKIWLHGSGLNNIVEMINKGKNNQMPAQDLKFNITQIKLLSAYVHKLSNQ